MYYHKSLKINKYIMKTKKALNNLDLNIPMLEKRRSKHFGHPLTRDRLPRHSLRITPKSLRTRAWVLDQLQYIKCTSSAASSTNIAPQPSYQPFKDSLSESIGVTTTEVQESVVTTEVQESIANVTTINMESAKASLSLKP